MGRIVLKMARIIPFTQIYAETWNAFQKINPTHCKNNDALRYENTKVNKNNKNIISYTLQEPIYLQSWPISPDTPQKTVDIVINTENIINIKENSCLCAGIELSYYEREPRTQTLRQIEYMRYDYHPLSDDIAHPLFHMHLFKATAPKKIPGNMKKMLNANTYKVMEDRKVGELRVPVPYMTLPCVLTMLVASHLSAKTAEVFIRSIAKYDNKYPVNLLADQHKILISRRNIIGYNWYERAC